MRYFKKIFVFLLCISVLALQMPGAASAKYYLSATKPTKVSKNPPQIMATPEEAIPLVEAPKSEEKKSNKGMIWGLVGLVAIIGAVAAAAGGGGGGGGGKGGSGEGGIKVGW